MNRHTQAIRRQQLTNCLNVFDHFVGLALKRFRVARNGYCYKTIQSHNESFHIGNFVRFAVC